MKIRKIIGISLLVLFSSNICFASTGIVNTPAVRIREKATTDSKIITKAYEDDELEILGEEGDWYKVKFDGKEGYASKSLIKEKGSSSAKNETTTNTNTASNNTNTANNNTANTNTTSTNTASSNSTNTSVNNETSSNETSNPEQNEANTTSESNSINGDAVLKVMPNFASNEIRLLTKDTKVEVLKELNNWCEISVDGTSGWVLKNKINKAEVVPNEQTPEPEPEEKPAENTTAENTSTNTAKNETNTNTTNTSTSSQNTAVTNTTASSSTSSDNGKSKKGKINVETANVRSKASKSSAILNCLDVGDEVTIVAEEGDWYKISSSKVESGYVLKSLITVSDVSNRSAVREETKQEEPVEEEISTVNSSKETDVVNFAKQYLGYSYVLGGKTPESGFDCSGYTRYVYKNFGYSLGTVAAEQNNLGTEIAREDLKEGDLILFYNEEKTKIGHTGIYIGNNEFIHAANPDRGVVTDNLITNSYDNERFVAASRIVE